MLAKAGRELSSGKLKRLFAFPLSSLKSSTSNHPFLDRQNSNPKHPGIFIRPSIEKQKSDSIMESNLHLLPISQEPEVIDSIKREVVVEPNSDDLNPKDDEAEKVCAGNSHSLRHYGKVKDPTVENLLPDFDLGRRLGSASGAGTVVSMVVDASDFDGSFPKRVAKLVSRTIDENDRAWKEGRSGNVPRVVVVVTKIDLLPSSLSPTRFEQWVRQRAREGGLSEITKLHFVSPVKNWGIKDLADDVAAMAGKRGHVWAVGSQNAGKSTLINAVGKVFGGKVWHSTEAPVPGTTLGTEGVLPFEAKLFDTPGLLNPHQITTRLTREEQRLVHIGRELKPRTYRIKEGYTVHIGGLMRLDIDESSSVDSMYVTVWASPSVPLHMGKKENAHKALEEHFGSRLQPPIGEKRVEEMGKWVRKEFRVSGSSWDTSSVDIAVSGLGWFAVGLKGDAVLGVWTHQGIDVFVRDSLLPQRALTFEDSGFTVSKIVAEADRAFNQNSSNVDVQGLTATMNFRRLLVSSHLLRRTAPARLGRTCTFPAPAASVSAEKAKSSYVRSFSSSPEPSGGAIGRSTIADVAALVSPAVVQIHVPQSIYGGDDESNGSGMCIDNGSGMCIDNVGTILTCAHVVLPADKPITKSFVEKVTVSITFPNGEQFDGSVRKYDMTLDVAIVKIEKPSREFTKAVLGTSSLVRAGDWAVSIGSPLLLRHSISFGIISSIERNRKDMMYHCGINRPYFQTDCFTNEGSSGGPLLDLDGKVIGINFRGLENSWGVHESCCGFAIPVDYAKGFISSYYNRYDRRNVSRQI